MKETISLYIGQCGLQMGQACWELFRQEHRINSQGEFTQCCNDDYGYQTFFTQCPDGSIVPRALLIDTEPSVIDDIKASEYGRMIPSDQIITGKDDAANNWGKGFSEMSRYGDTVMEKLDRLCASCSSLQGIFVFNSTGGGTGSGLGSAILRRLRDDFGKLPIFSFCAWPSPKLSTTVVEPYNTILSLESQLDAATISIVLDNQALYDICHQQLSIESPSYITLNQLVSQTMSSWTSSLRFPGTLNLDMNEMVTNLVPYPDLHFMLTSYAPILPRKPNSGANDPQFSAEYLTSALFRPESLFAKCDPAQGYYLACSLMYRGNFTPREISNAIGQLRTRQKNPIQFVDWCPTGYKYGMNSKAPCTVPNSAIGAMERSVCSMMNTTAIQEVFERVSDRFDMMYTQKSYLHWYACEGIGSEEFEIAKSRVNDLISEYQSAEGEASKKPNDRKKVGIKDHRNDVDCDWGGFCYDNDLMD